MAGEEGAMCYARGTEGRFALVTDAEGDTWDADWPVFNVHFGCAVAYGRWLALRTGQPWRLPGELEWEKAARNGSAPSGRRSRTFRRKGLDT